MPVNGFLEAIEPFQIRGWALDSDHPSEPLKIEIRLGDKLVASATANLFRDDLGPANIGHGARGFAINFGTPLDPARIQHLSAVVVRKGGERTSLALLPRAEPASATELSLRTDTARLLKKINAAVAEGDIVTALRYADHLRRTFPKDAIIAHLLGRLLGRQGDYEKALAQLEAVTKIAPTPDIEATIVEVLFKLGRFDEASRRLSLALQSFAITPELAKAARSLCARLAPALAGWVGITAELELMGEIFGSESPPELEICTSQGRIVARAKAIRRTKGTAGFSVTIPSLAGGTRLSVQVAGAPLLGNGLAFPPAFRVDGRAATTAHAIAGWASIGWLPGVPPSVLIEDTDGASHAVATHSDPANPGHYSYELDIRKVPLKGPRILVSVALPGGGTERLPDSPLLFVDAIAPVKNAALAPLRRPAKKAGKMAKRTRRHGAAIIVPVYLGLNETLACLHSLFATVANGPEIIAIEDASPDAEISKLLDKFAKSGLITLLRNPKNIGFAASVNRGLAHCGKRDAVVINSDVVVHGNWLERLRKAAYSASNIGTVTPLTDDGTITSYPATGTSDGEDGMSSRLDAITAVANAGVTVDLPVGVGFCLYIRHDCFAETGGLDAATFDQGYGEEADFCMRARARGWRHLLAANVFVHHAGGRSFGKRREALLERSGRILNLKYPGYDAYVQAFLAADPVALVRRRIDETLLREDTRSYVLLVSLALSGGVARHVTERAEGLRKRGFEALILEPSKTHADACVMRGSGAQMAHLRYSVPKELTLLRKILLGLTLDHIEIHHYLGHAPQLIELICSLGIPYDVYIHDYVWICPRVTLMRGEAGYCGEPEVSACEICIKTHGSNLPETISVADLRARSARWLNSARSVIAPSNDVATRLARYFPEAESTVLPWEEFPAVHAPAMPRGKTIRVAVIGAINASKGYRVLLACARDAVRRKLGLEFLVIGYTEDDAPLTKTGKVFVTGKYSEDEVADLLMRERPHLALFPSVWPETWCYALTHALSANLPIMAFDIGTVAERLRESGIGELVSPQTQAARLNDLMLKYAAKSWQDRKQSPSSVQGGKMSRKRPRDLPTAAPVEIPASEKSKVPESRLPQAAAPGFGELAATVKAIDLARGLYTFSVRTGSPVAWGGSATLCVPAVHVAVSPGVPADGVEFIPGLPERGTWLYQSGDALVANVKANSATLLVTSLRAPGSEPLAIEVEQVGRSSNAVIGPNPAGVPPGKPAAPVEPLPRSDVRLEILAHVQNRGDIRFVDVPWAGRTGPGLAIEAFSITLLAPFSANDIEYKGLTATGFETPWVSNGGVCGSKGKSTPLVGFAVKLKHIAAKQFDCEYRGYFRSGRTVGPLRNGTPCRSTASNDPLEGIHIRLAAKANKDLDARKNETDAVKVLKPKFGKFRDILESADIKAVKTIGTKTQALKPGMSANPGTARGAKRVRAQAPDALAATEPGNAQISTSEKPRRT